MAAGGGSWVEGPAETQLDLPLPDLPPRHVLTIIGGPGETRIGLCGCGDWDYSPTKAHPDVIAAAHRWHLADVRC